jgi:hypothetical protein
VNNEPSAPASDTLPDQVGSLLLALHQYGVRAQRHSVAPQFDQTFLVNTDPVGKRAELYLVYYCVFLEVIAAAIREEGFLGSRFFLWRPAQKISAGELQAVRTHDSYEHVSVRVVHDVPGGILTERVADLTVFDAPVFPRYESPGANERIRCHRRPTFALWVSALARIILSTADAGRKLSNLRTKQNASSVLALR